MEIMVEKQAKYSFLKNYILIRKDKSNPKEATQNRDKILILSSFYAIALNLILGLLKIGVFLFTSSISILADSINNLSDSFSSLILYIGTKLSAKEADETHPYGHGRIEYISGFLIAVIVLIMGLSFMKLSVNKMIKPESLRFSTLSIVIMLITIFVKLYMSIFFDHVSKSLDSIPAKAHSRDYIGDAVITTVIFVSMLVNRVFGIVIDAYLGFLISLYITYLAYGLIMDAISDMIGKAPKFMTEPIRERIMQYDGIEVVCNMVLADFGPKRIYVTAVVGVDSKKSFIETHDMLEQIEREVSKEFNCTLTLRANPVEAECLACHKKFY